FRQEIVGIDHHPLCQKSQPGVNVRYQLGNREGKSLNPSLQRMMVTIQDNRQKAEERDEAARQREDEELAGGMPPFRSATDTYQEEQRQQCQLEENIEKDDVERQKNADHAGSQGQEPGVKLRDTVGNRSP